MTDQSMTVNVRVFAGLREHAGASRATLTVPVDTIAGDVGEAFWRSVGARPPLSLAQIVVAVNRTYAKATTVLHDGDELALIPPVSGGAPADALVGHVAGDLPAGVLRAAVTAEPIDQTALYELVARREAGAIVTFAGTPRDVPQLDYEAHETMAAERIAAILGEVVTKHAATAAAAEHRVGAVPWPGAAVVVAVSAPHRGEAFAAAREALDRIKAEAPIWKQEVDGDQRARVIGTVPTGADRLGRRDAFTATPDTATAPPRDQERDR